MSLPVKPPSVESTMPTHEAPRKIPSTAPAKTPAPKTPEHGTRDKASGGVVYDSSKPRKSGGMIRVSKILTRYHQELEVQEDEPGESLLLRPAPPQG